MAAWSEFLGWLEQSMLGHAVRSSGVWTYGVINLAHILGIATLFGAVLILDLRLIGWPRRLDLQSVAAVTVPLSIGGFTLAVLSGVSMLATNGTEYASNPFFAVKFSAIAIGLLNAGFAARSAAWRNRTLPTIGQGDRRRLATFGLISLASWLTALSAGRMIGYW